MALQPQTTAGWQQQMTALKRQILELKDIIDEVLMAPSSGVALPEPDKLDDITDYDIWIPYLTAKLQLEKAISTSDKEKKIIFFYIYAQLGPKIKAQVLSTLNIADITHTYDHQQLLDHLKSLRAGLNKGFVSNRNSNLTVRRYLDLLHGTDKDVVSLVSREFPNDTRYQRLGSVVATT
jgi:hypothetical protein